MQALKHQMPASKAEKISFVIDHLVDALGSDPGCTLRRALVLADIDQNKNTTQSAIMERLGIHKSALNRDIEWLYDYGCIMRVPGNDDRREISLYICGYAKKNLDYALSYFGHSHNNLKFFLFELISMFGEHKATLRDAKIMATLSVRTKATKQELSGHLYNSPNSTEARALKNMVDLGLVEEKE